MRSGTGSAVRFLLTFAVVYAVLLVFLNGSGPVPALDGVVASLTALQTAAAAALLRAAGQDVTQAGDVLAAPGFFCTVGEGCNGMSALILVLAGILTFPVPARRKLAGALLLVPAVLLVNTLRITALFLVGLHRNAWFHVAHVYVGQVVVIAVTAALWWTWLSWSSRLRNASPSR